MNDTYALLTVKSRPISAYICFIEAYKLIVVFLDCEWAILYHLLFFSTVSEQYCIICSSCLRSDWDEDPTVNLFYLYYKSLTTISTM